jgi:hypothetical protein
MKIFELPELHNDQVRWLEQEIIGAGFSPFVAEVAAVHGTSNDSTWLTDQQLDAACQSGINSLEPSDFKRLLASPAELLRLRGRVLEKGGEYWTDLINRSSTVDSQTIDAGWHQFTELRQTKKNLNPARTNAQPSSNSMVGKITWAIAASVATAAACLLFLQPPANSISKVNPKNNDQATATLNPDERQANSAWGFEKFSNQLPTATPDRQEYLNQLATAAETWSNKRADSPQALANRLLEFRKGCSMIMLASHPLPKSDQVWLKDRCQSWARALNKHIEAVELGGSVEEITASVDSTVVRIAAALRGRADSAS